MGTKTKGFLTIATGNIAYYKLAYNLLRSYKLFSTADVPFCLLCDSENEFTKEFDDVIVMDTSYRNYLDKLQIFKYTPYDETIFIDADSLAYDDLNKWWDFFENSTDFSAFGIQRELDSGLGFFDPDLIGDYKNMIVNIPDFTAGVYYIRRSEISKNVFELANHLANHYHEYGFKRFVYSPADEPVLALSMAVNHCTCNRNIYDFEKKKSYICLMPRHNNLNADIAVPSVLYKIGTEYYAAELIHWGNQRTKRCYYRFEVEKLNRVLANEARGIIYQFLYKYRLRYGILLLEDIRLVPKRIDRYIAKQRKNDHRETSKLI